jgi:carboxymethylenebutenolidase
MADWIELEADDGHKFKAYRAAPDGAAKGGIVLLQEIFGVNSHIRSLVDGFAADGYLTVAPSLYDRIEPGIELGYSEDEITRGRELRSQIPIDDVVRDMAATKQAVDEAGKIGAVGYCWGGTLAWLCATRLGVDCAVGYYGSMTIDFVDEQPACPVTMMLGETDATFPPENIEAIRAKHPDVVIFTYPAGHGFACDQRGSYHEPSARLARERTLDVFRRYLG